MALIKEILEIIEEFAPKELAAEYDNSGLKTGDIHCKCTGILITVDTTEKVVREAIENHCNLIIEHHPSIWGGIRSLEPSVPLNRALVAAAFNGIVLYSAHTNVDFTEGGLNDFVAQNFHLQNIKTVCGVDSARIGQLNVPTDLKHFAQEVSKIMNDDNVYTVGDLNKPVRTVAVVNGAGGGCEKTLWDAFSAGADVLVTSEVKHNVARLANEINCAIINCGHYESETFFGALIKNLMGQNFPTIPTFIAKSVKSPVNKRGELWS